MGDRRNYTQSEPRDPRPYDREHKSEKREPRYYDRKDKDRSRQRD